MQVSEPADCEVDVARVVVLSSKTMSDVTVDGRTASALTGRYAMLSWAVTFLVVAIIAGVLGLSGVAGTASSIAYALFVIFVILALIGFVTGRKPTS